jgi:pimeloyl-ACP methyl ester carboxylesterase
LRTEGRQLTSTLFVDRLKSSIRNSELLIFDGCAHSALYENVAEFNQPTLAFSGGTLERRSPGERGLSRQV